MTSGFAAVLIAIGSEALGSPKLVTLFFAGVAGWMGVKGLEYAEKVAIKLAEKRIGKTDE